jgi:hypothetical protein
LLSSKSDAITLLNTKSYTITSIVIFIFLLYTISLSAQNYSFSGGEGSKENPWLVANHQDLDNVRNYPDAHYLQIADIHLVNLWHPIPIFNGLYDGGGYYITNLNIDTILSCSCSSHSKRNRRKSQFLSTNFCTADNTGFFSVLNGGELTQVRIIGGRISGNNYTAALVGSNEGGVISFCSVENVSISGSKDVGGLVGSNFGTIDQSYTASSTVTGITNTGGLVGTNYGRKITDSYAINEVQGTKTTGGFIGLNSIEGLIQNCYAAGTISGEVDLGGLVGRNLSAQVLNSYWDIESSGQATSAAGTGISTREMLQEATFTNWNFEPVPNEPDFPVWFIADFNPYIRKHYPILQWQLDQGQEGWLTTNQIDNGHVKMYKDRLVHWESFPRLEYQDDVTYTLGLLDQLVYPQGIHRVYKQDGGYMQFRYNQAPHIWIGAPSLFGFTSSPFKK